MKIKNVMGFAVITMIFTATILWAQAVKINDDTGSAVQISPRVAKNASGPSAIVWTDFRGSTKGDIYMQFLGSKGFPFPGKMNMKVNDDNGDADRGFPDVAIDKKGHPVVVWADKRNGFWTEVQS